MKFKSDRERTRDFSAHRLRLRPRSVHHGGGVFRLAGLLGVRSHAAALRPYRRLLRLLRPEEAKHHLRVSHGRQGNGHVPHIYVTDCQVPN